MQRILVGKISSMLLVKKKKVWKVYHEIVCKQSDYIKISETEHGATNDRYHWMYILSNEDRH